MPQNQQDYYLQRQQESQLRKAQKNERTAAREQGEPMGQGGVEPNHAKNRVGETAQASPTMTAEQIQQQILQATETKLQNAGVYQQGAQAKKMITQPNRAYAAAQKEVELATREAEAQHEKDNLMRTAVSDAVTGAFKSLSGDKGEAIYHQAAPKSAEPQFGFNEESHEQVKTKGKQLSTEGRKDAPSARSGKTLDSASKDAKNVIIAGNDDKKSTFTVDNEAAPADGIAFNGQNPEEKPIVNEPIRTDEQSIPETSMQFDIPDGYIEPEEEDVTLDLASVHALFEQPAEQVETAQVKQSFNPFAFKRASNGFSGKFAIHGDNVDKSFVDHLMNHREDIMGYVGDELGIPDGMNNAAVYVVPYDAGNDKKSCVIAYAGFDELDTDINPSVLQMSIRNAVDTVLKGCADTSFAVEDDTYALTSKERSYCESKSSSQTGRVIDTASIEANAAHVEVSETLMAGLDASRDKSNENQFGA